MEPSEAIETGENVLRSIVRELLGERWQTKVSAAAVAETLERKKLEPKQRPGALETDDLLSYVDTPVLARLILEQWSIFAPVFGNIKRTKQCLNAFVVYRRRVAHNRPLLPFERDLLSGLSGQFRNQVSLYRQSKSAAPQFFAQIETAIDPEGREGRREREYSQLAGVLPVVRAGETLVFSATATDPRGRSIEWCLHAHEYSFRTSVPGEFSPVTVGESARIEWTPQPDDFFATIYVQLSARNSSGFYADRDGWDDAVLWTFLFEPPY